MRVTVHTHAPVAADACAFGIGDTRIHHPARGFAGPRGVNRLFGSQIPGMVEVEIGNLARQLLGIGKPGTVVLGGISGNVAGLLHRLGDRARRQVSGAGRALRLPK